MASTILSKRVKVCNHQANRLASTAWVSKGGMHLLTTRHPCTPSSTTKAVVVLRLTLGKAVNSPQSTHLTAKAANSKIYCWIEILLYKRRKRDHNRVLRRFSIVKAVVSTRSNVSLERVKCRTVAASKKEWIACQARKAINRGLVIRPSSLSHWAKGVWHSLSSNTNSITRVTKTTTDIVMQRVKSSMARISVTVIKLPFKNRSSISVKSSRIKAEA